MNIKLDPARRLARKKAMTGCWIGPSAQSRKSFRLKAPVAAPSVGQDVTAGEDMGLQKTLQTGQISPALLLAAQPRQEFLNGKNVFFSQGPRCFIQGRIISSSLRLTNIDNHKIFFGGKAVMYKKTSNISIFSCITKP
jgi:hypothetical protein